MLQKITCQTCGGLLELSEDSKYGKCPFCQNEYHFKEEKAEALALMLNLGFENLSRHDFDGAISTFRSVAMNYPEDAEANWGLVISTYGIIFEKDDRTGKMIPTCSRIVEKSILENDFYKKAIANAHPEQRPFYEEMAREIEKKQAEIKEIMENEESFDAFISFKASDKDGHPTQDSRYARKIYDELTGRGIKTFFSPVTLSARTGEDYEPIIYKALNTCKLFILVATSEEYLNATWVKNEWTRFRDRMDEDKRAIVVPVYQGPEILRMMPTKFQRTQGIDLEKHAFDYDIVIADNAENVIGISEKKKKEAEQRAIEEPQRQLPSQQAKPKREKVKKEKKALTEAEKQAKKKKTKKALMISLIAFILVAIITGVVLALTVFAPAKLVYERVDGGYAVSVNKANKLEGELTIPSTYNGEPVVELCYGAFAGSSITSVTIPDSVTSIEGYAFKDCTSLTSVTIPDSVTTIGNYAFSGCTSLARVTIPDSVTTIGESAFYCCTSLTSVTIGDSVTSIEWSAFYGCTSLTSVTIPDSVTTIESFAFSECTSLTIYCEAPSQPSGWGPYWNDSDRPVVWGYDNDTEFTYTVSDTNATITDYAGTATELVIPSTIDGYTVTGVGASAFSGCTSLTSVTIPDSVTSIGNSAFYGCTSLASVTIGDRVTLIGFEAFRDCDSLTSVTIPESVTSIGAGAFRDCTSLTIYCEAPSQPSGWSSNWKNSSCTVVWGYDNGTDDNNNNTNNDNTDTGNDNTDTEFTYTVSGTNATITNYTGTATELVIPSTLDGYTVTEIGDWAFSGCNSLTSITIGNSVTTIGESAFYGCTSLASVTIGNGVTTIGGEAFYGCTSLASVTIGNSVTTIGESAFRDCTSLASVTIGNSVTYIGETAFSGCTSLTSVEIPSSVTTIGYWAFEGCTSLTSVNYLGTIEQWCNISFGNYYANPLNNGASLYLNGVLVTDLVIPSTVTQIKGSAFSGCTSLTSVTIPSSVTTIGSSAFEYCTSLTSVTIPSSVTSIGEFAFWGCSSLTIYCEAPSQPSGWDSNWNFSDCPVVWEYDKFTYTVSGTNAIITGYTGTATELYIPSTINGMSVTGIGNYAFWGCTSLTSVEIPSSVTSIGNNAFRGCTSLTSVEIPSSVTSIGYDAFYECTSITSVNYLGTIEQWCSISFGDYSANPSYYGAKLYISGALVTDLVIPNTVTEIKSYAFYGYTSLTSVEIPSSVTTIGSSAFEGCTSLTSVEIPSSVTSIEGYAFLACTSLTSVEIPSSVTTIESYAFYGCDSLTSVNYLGTIEQWCDISFSDGTANPLNNGAMLSLNGALVTDLVIPSTVTQIKGSAFSGCTSLTSVTIPSSVTTIGSNAFDGCTSLTSVEIPSSVTTIENYAFLGCTSLTSVTIPSSVTAIGSWAFYDCTSLTIYCEASNRPSGWSSSWNYTDCPVVWGYTGE